jgi:hypothetical protein
MSYIDTMNSSGGPLQLLRHRHQPPLPAPGLTKEERNAFLLQDLCLNVAVYTDVFMEPSTQLLSVSFNATAP